MSNNSLEDHEYVEACLRHWKGASPISMSVIEFHGTADPWFGGSADDRPLGKDGTILARPYRKEDVAEFSTIQEAHEAAKKIPNRRGDSTLGVATLWRRRQGS
jgi:hypothetical protein